MRMSETDLCPPSMTVFQNQSVRFGVGPGVATAVLGLGVRKVVSVLDAPVSRSW